MTDTKIFDGATVKAHLNQKTRVPVRFWESLMDRELLVDQLHPRMELDCVHMLGFAAA